MDRPAAIPALVAVALAATLLVAVTAATSFGRSQPGAGPTARDEVREPQPLEPVDRFLGEPRPVAAEGSRSAPAEGSRAARPSTPPGFGVVRVRSGRSIRLYAKPKGAGVATVAARTQFGSRSVMSVVRRRGKWLAVTTTALGNGKLAWVRADAPALDRGRVQMAISIDLSKRTLELRRGKRLVKTVKVAIGRPGSSTPKGRFAVTDKIPGSRYGSYYGCCILALNGTQPNTPAGWRGGNRLAIHGTNSPGTIGSPSSAGCLRAAEADLRTLMRRVPLGTPVFVHG
jgi:lipoprotein-anchoring transpeptidase ErfK/SrfK